MLTRTLQVRVAYDAVSLSHLRCDVALARTNGVAAVLNLHLDVVPAAVLLPLVVVPKVVLLAQFVGDVRRRRIEVAEAADDLRPAAGVVGDASQRSLVHVLASNRPSPRAAALAREELRRQLEREPSARNTSAAREGN